MNTSDFPHPLSGHVDFPGLTSLARTGYKGLAGAPYPVGGILPGLVGSGIRSWLVSVGETA